MNGSHEPYISVASSSDSNGNLWEDSHRERMTLQRMSVDVHRLKSWGQQAYLDSRRKLPPFGKPPGGPTAPLPPYAQSAEVRGRQGQTPEESPKQPHIPSYQQINCVDSIIRYLESCTVPALKRKSKSLSITPSSSSSASEEDKTPADRHGNCVHTEDMTLEPPAAPDSQVSAGSAAAVVGAPLTDITLSSIAMSVVSVTSQCSYSSTIVHVPQPESEVTALEDAPMGSEQADPAPPLTPRPLEEFRVVGLTKEVLSAHTQKEEQEYVDRFRHRILQSPYSSYLQQDNSSLTHSHQQGEYTLKPVSAHGDRHKSETGRPRHKRLKPQGSSDSYASPPWGNFRPPRRPPQAPDSSWPPSESSQPQPASSLAPPLFIPFQAPYFNAPGQVWGYTMGSAPQSNAWSQQGGALFVLQPDQITQPMQNVQPVQPMQNVQPMQPMQNVQPVQPMQNVQPMQPMQNVQPVQPMQNVQPMQPLQNMQPVQPMQNVQPMQLLQNMQPVQPMQNVQPMQPLQNMQPVQPMQNVQPMQPMQNMQTLQLMQTLPPMQNMQPCMAPVMALILPNYPIYPNYPLYPQDMTPGAAPPVLPQPFGPPGVGPAPDHAGLAPQPQAPPFMASSNPPSSLGEEAVAAQPTALFSSSRSSSPLQLNLLQEELPRCGTGHESLTEPPHVTGDDAASDSGNHDNQSTSSKLLDLMMQADACSGTGSNASGSRSGESGESLGSGSGSGSNGTSTSHTGSSNTSKYFASNDSSDSSRKACKSQEASALDRAGLAPRIEDSPWTFIQQTPEPILMTYQIHSRDHTQVLQEDWEKLIQVQSQQPCFSQQQMEELAQVHPWIKQRTLPQEIDTQGCIDCCTGPNDPLPRPQTPDSSCPFDSPPDDPTQPSDT
ncbi:hypothetical protein GJAV_G00169900 [Gymnothorax javanicus]|nr:hypothetical protein GJAV_G00169900 [Gymnothorax javanicus]